MENLANPQNTIALIQKYGFHFQKRFGQNFLIDTHVLHKIIEGADIGKEDCVVEIGPGIGTMTEALARAAGKVIAVEIDKNLIPILQETLAGFDNVEIINEDILKLDLQTLARVQGEGRTLKVVANLPYYITTPIIMSLFESDVPLHSLTVMVQKEVALRMQTGPGSKDYGALSLAVQYYAKPKLLANVPPNCFIPRPKVGSAVIRLDKHSRCPVSVQDRALLFKLIRAAFMQRRKTLQNALQNSSELSFTKEQICTALAKLGLDPSIRGEVLNLEQFAALADSLYFFN